MPPNEKTDPDDPPPPLPRLDLKATFALRRELYARCWKAFEADNRVSGDAYRDLVDNIVGALGGPGRADPSAVADSVAYLLGTEATDRALWALAWRLAGNRGALRDGRPARPWSLQREPEWAPLHVIAARPEPRAYRAGPRPGCTYTFQALSGPYCPGTLSLWWSRPQYALISRGLGCTPPRGKYPLRHATELVGLRLFGLLTPGECQGGRAGFRKVACGSAMKEHNRHVLAVRGRQVPCPRRYQHPCHRCGVGYRGPDACEYATHARAYEARACPGCGEPAAAFDPEEPAGRCVACSVKDRFRSEEKK